MVMELTQHPAGIIEEENIGVMQLTIHRIKKHELTLQVNNQSLQISHYGGPTKQNPPLPPTKSLSAEELEGVSRSVKFSQQRDAAYLFQIHTFDKPVEWAGFNGQEDRLQPQIRKSKQLQYSVQ